MNTRNAVIVVFVVILAALYFFNRKPVTLLKQDQYRLDAISVTGYGLQSVIHIKNPNLLSGTIKTIHEDFYMNNVLLGKLEITLDQGVPGMKESVFPVSIRFEKALLNQIKTDSTQTTAAISTTGEIVWQSLFGSGQAKVQQTDTVALNSL